MSGPEAGLDTGLGTDSPTSVVTGGLAEPKWGPGPWIGGS